MARKSERTRGRRSVFVTTGVLIAGALASCMTSPKHGQVLPRMGTTIGMVAFGIPGSVFRFEYALYRNTGSGYVIDEWRPLGTCTTSTPIFTDVQNVQWQGCAITTGLPISDCTKGGRGAWHADPNNQSGPDRYARVRTSWNGAQLFVFNSTVSDQELADSYNSVGGLGTIGAYQAGSEADLHVTMPTVGAGSFSGNAAANDVVVVGDRAYVGRANGTGPEFGIFEVADAGNPQLRKGVEIGATVNKVFVEGDYAYLATSDPIGQLVLVSIADPDAAAVVSRIPLSGSEAASAITAVGGTVLVGRKNRAGGEELEVWVPQDPLQPTNLIKRDVLEIGADVNAIDVTTGLFVAPASNIVRTVAYLATSHATNKVWGVDVTDPSNIFTHGMYVLTGAFGMRDIEYHRGFVYAVSDDNAGPDVFIFQVGGATGNVLTLSGSRALNTNNTGVTFYGGKLLVSTQAASKVVTTVDPTTVPPGVIGFTQGATGSAALAVRHGVAHLATTGPAALQLASPGLQLEPALPSQNNVIGCLGDSNTAQGNPLCDGISCWPFGCVEPTCQSGQSACSLQSQTSIETSVSCPGGGSPSCPVNGGNPICLLSWCTRMQLCLTANPLSAPSYCAVEGRYWAPRPTWSSVNTGAGLATIQSNPSHPADGPEQLAASLANGANAFVIALGSVDVPCVNAPPAFGAILNALDALKTQAGGAPVFYTIPLPFSEVILPSLACTGCEVSNGVACYNRSMLQYRNRLLHELPPERIIDFHSGVVRSGPAADFGGDGVHVNANGQNKRARAALSKLAD